MDNTKLKYPNFYAQPDFEKILTNPILDIAARFWDDDRYEAFQVCYRSMRVIDDLVDDRKEKEIEMSASEKKELESLINHWMIQFEKNQPIDDFQKELLDIKHKFNIPLWPWQRLAKSMIFDIYHIRFDSFLTFLRYTEGAAISPASIFMHLCGVSKSGTKYKQPVFDIRYAARYLALFSYLVHIMRDFEKDQKRSLNYFAFDLMQKNNLTDSELRNAALRSKISGNIRQLFQQYYDIAHYYQNKSRKLVNEIQPSLQDRYQLSYELIFQLYSQIFDRIDTKNGTFTENELLPSAAERKSRIDQTVSSFVP
ncbi:MAG: hypothetical protein DWP97_09095 [Calditrichaeota bacterium]|nr:MAG: hypothetical protein DWP97_09095 [Calditrichota bacterium]